MRNEAIATSATATATATTATAAEHSAGERAVEPAADRVGHIETHGADYIPPAERHGRPRELFWVWMSANIIYLYFVIGGVLMLLGLPLWEALAITIVGNLWWAAVGWLAISGPASGTPSVAIMRAMFGVRGSRIFGAGLGVVIGVFYEIINIAFATLAAIAMIEWFGITLPAGAEWGVLAVIGALSFAISIYGHATILKLAPWFSAALAVMFVVLGGFVFGSADLSYAPIPLEPAEHIAMVLLGFAIVASSPLSWGTGADYARYLPRDVSKAKVAVWTALGGFIPAVAIGTLGVIAGTVIDMTDPQLTIAEIVPAWFMPVFLGMIVLSSITNNVLVAYSTGLYALGLGVRVSRVATIVVTGLASTAAAAWLLFIAPSFLDTLNSSLELAVTVLGPLVAVYAVDILLRRNSYDGQALAAERRDGPFWYRGGFFWPGIIAMTAATTTAVLMANTTLYVGPFALALGGADLSAIVGPVLAGILYAVLWRTSAPYREPSARPAASWDDAAQDPARDAARTAPRDVARTARSHRASRPGSRSGARDRGGDARMTWRMPAETAPHDRTWMAFPREGITLGDTATEREEAYGAWTAVAHAVAEFEPLTMVVDPSESERAHRMLGSGIAIVETPLDEFWMRDVGPTFVVDDERPAELGAVDWTFNGWGAPEWAEWRLSAELGRAVGGLAGAAVISSLLVNEGGGIHVDGEGTVLLTETVQLDPRRNPFADRARVEAELARTIGATTFVWLPRGLTRDYDDFGTNGHVDIVATLPSPGRLLLHAQGDPGHPDFEVCHELREHLSGQTDAAGRAFEIIDLPAPATLKDHEGFVDWSYVNHAVVNGGVIACGFGEERADVAAREILADAYPGRRVVTVDARPIFARGGGIHCITQQQPAVVRS